MAQTRVVRRSDGVQCSFDRACKVSQIRDAAYLRLGCGVAQTGCGVALKGCNVGVGCAGDCYVPIG